MDQLQHQSQQIMYPFAPGSQYYTTFSPDGQPKTYSMSSEMQAANLEQPTVAPRSLQPLSTIWDDLDKDVGPEYIDRDQLKREFQSLQIPSRPTLSGTLLSPLDSKQPTLPLIADNDLNDDISDIEMPAESSHSRESGRKYLVAKSKPNPPRAASLGSKTRRKADISSKLQRSQYETKRYQY